MKRIIIPVHFTLGEIIKAAFIASLLRPMMIAIMSVALLGFIFFYPIFFVRFWAAWIFIAMPLWIIFLAWRNFKSNPLMREKQRIEITENGIRVIGESFSMERSWISIHRVDHKYSFVFIWLTKRAAYPLSVSKFSKGDLSILSKIVKAHPHIKNGLKQSL